MSFNSSALGRLSSFTSTLLTATVGMTLLVGCQQRQAPLPSPTFNARSVQRLSVPEAALQGDFSARARKGWQVHLSEVYRLNQKVQKGCEPFVKAARGQVKGSVMLFHGYTACPQQYHELAPLLAAQGYNVFVPLLPGHGRPQVTRKGKVTDDTFKLPEEKGIFVYEGFTWAMGDLLKDEPGEKIAAGLSLGGAMAAHAMLKNPQVFDRGIMMTPLLDVAAPRSLLLPTVGPLIPHRRIGWGEKCENERRLGRAGYCEFDVTHVSAVRNFGLNVLKQVSQIKKPVQIVGVEKDPAASNSAMAKAYHRIPDAHACFFEYGTDHSMLSPQDNPGEDMFWLPQLKRQLVRYITTGQYFTTLGRNQTSEHGLRRCQSR